MNEIWKDIQGYEGLYQVSNLGRVRSLDRKVQHPKGGKRFSKGQIIKPGATPKGYLFVQLSSGSEICTKRVNRLVAEAFIPNPKNLPVVNHKDKDRANNSVANLEWCTVEYNNRYSCTKAVLQFDRNGKFIAAWDAVSDASRATGINAGNIVQCCKGNKYKTVGNFIWRYKEVT